MRKGGEKVETNKKGKKMRKGGAEEGAKI